MTTREELLARIDSHDTFVADSDRFIKQQAALEEKDGGWVTPGTLPKEPGKRHDKRGEREALRNEAEARIERISEACQFARQEIANGDGDRQQYDKRTLPVFIRAFGATRDPASLDVRDWENYIRSRRTGQLAPGGKGKPVRNRIIEQDLRLLKAVLNWATKCRDAGGRFLLDRNPLDGLKAPKERNPVRAVLSAEQFKALRAAATEHSALAERFVMLAWYTGRRSSSIRQLRWSDIDIEAGTIRWRAETDKVGKEACRADAS